MEKSSLILGLLLGITLSMGFFYLRDIPINEMKRIIVNDYQNESKIGCCDNFILYLSISEIQYHFDSSVEVENHTQFLLDQFRFQDCQKLDHYISLFINL